jgi:hypothetical protein
MRNFSWTACLLTTLIALSSAGCGGSTTPPSVENTGAAQAANADVATIKSRLEPIAKNGGVGASDIYGLDESLKKIGKPELVGELNKLMTTKDKEQIKKIAQGIIDKL